MMKKFFQISIVLLMLIGIILAMSTRVSAANEGPSDSYSYIRFMTKGDDGDYTDKTVYMNQTYDGVISGVSYDKSTNTLTICNYQNSNTYLDINEMGTDFKIKLVGKNILSHIQLWGFMYGSGLQLTGSGSLDIEGSEWDNAITIEAEKSLGFLTVDPTVTLKLTAKTNAFAINDTTWANPFKVVGFPNIKEHMTDVATTYREELPNGEVYIDETTTFVDNYEWTTVFKPEEWDDEFTLFTKSGDSTYVYGGKQYASMTYKGTKYTDCWALNKFKKVGDTYYAITGDWNWDAIINVDELSTSGYTNTETTFRTYYWSGVQDLELGKDTAGNTYTIYEYRGMNYVDGVSTEVNKVYVYNIGDEITVDGKNVKILTLKEIIEKPLGETEYSKVLKSQSIYVSYKTQEKTINIVPVTGKKDISKVKAAIGLSTVNYTGKAITRGVTLTDGNYTLVKGTDYKVTYKNNVNVGTATITITAAGDKYYGSFSKNFQIVSATAKPLSKIKIQVGLSDAQYTGKPITKGMTLTDGNYTLVKGKDYTVEYRDNVHAGTATIIITGKGEYYNSVEKHFKIVAPPQTSLTKIKLQVGQSNVTYTGKAITKGMTLTDGNYTLVKGKDYTVTYQNNVYAGKATITFTGIGNYKGTVQKSFKILPNAPTGLTSNARTKTSIKLKWAKPTSGCDGSKVYVYNESTGAWDIKADTTDCTTVITGLKPGVIYRFRVRGYITVGSSKMVGETTAEYKTPTTPEIPKMLSVAPTNNTFTKQLKQTWSKVTCTGYELQVWTSKAKSWGPVGGTTTATSHVSSGLVQEKLTYKYRVRAYTGTGTQRVYSPWSEEMSIIY